MNPNAQPTRLIEARQRNFSNRRIRTRTYGGGGGAEPRGFPLSRSLALFGPHTMSDLSPECASKRTSADHPRLTLRTRNHLDQNYKPSLHRSIVDGGVGAQQSQAENAV